MLITLILPSVYPLPPPPPELFPDAAFPPVAPDPPPPRFPIPSPPLSLKPNPDLYPLVIISVVSFTISPFTPLHFTRPTS